MVEKQTSQFIFLGVLLFLIGLIIGLVVPMMGNPRMGLAAHLEGIMNGMFLIVLGLIWSRVDLSDRLRSVTFWLALYGTFANLIAIFVAAVFNAGAMLPLAGGKAGGSGIEALITFLLFSLSGAMVAMCVLILMGLRNNMKRG